MNTAEGSHARLPMDELKFRALRASGPGGQNVNKVASAVELRFDVLRSRGLSAEVKHRLQGLAGRRLNARGELVIFAQRFRTQERNRKDAIERLQALVRRAGESPKPRRVTRPSRASKLRRLDSKHRVADKKRLRRNLGND
ncbi:MAG: alternative ribosome rescue aminoacyl-tRNA hydrolase ArfB [Gammaproteobacteria bacterium]